MNVLVLHVREFRSQSIQPGGAGVHACFLLPHSAYAQWHSGSINVRAKVPISYSARTKGKASGYELPVVDL